MTDRVRSILILKELFISNHNNLSPWCMLALSLNIFAIFARILRIVSNSLVRNAGLLLCYFIRIEEADIKSRCINKIKIILNALVDCVKLKWELFARY